MATIVAKCPECNALIAGPTQGQANRNLGLHRRSKHGYQSPDYREAKAYREKAKDVRTQMTPGRVKQLAAAREARWGHRPVSQTPEAIAKRRLEYQRQYRKLHPYKSKKAVAALPAPDAATPCKLSRCPVCDSAFYVVRGQQVG